MQLEAYSLKKAFALQILNDINLNLLQTENIQKLYTLEHFVVIFTAKRLICVEEVNSKVFNDNSQDFLRVRVGNHMYKHWNIFFNDILKLKFMALQKKSGDVYSQAARIIELKDTHL
jgi:hypothetical protein